MDTAMVSLPRPFNAVPASISLASSQHQHVQSLTFGPIKSSSNNINGETSNNEENASTEIPVPQAITPRDTVEVRFRRGSRRRRKQQQNGIADRQSVKVKTAAPKDWESMTITEKAIELHMEENRKVFCFGSSSLLTLPSSSLLGDGYFSGLLVLCSIFISWTLLPWLPPPCSMVNVKPFKFLRLNDSL